MHLLILYLSVFSIGEIDFDQTSAQNQLHDLVALGNSTGRQITNPMLHGLLDRILIIMTEHNTRNYASFHF